MNWIIIPNSFTNLTHYLILYKNREVGSSYSWVSALKIVENLNKREK